MPLHIGDIQGPIDTTNMIVRQGDDAHVGRTVVEIGLRDCQKYLVFSGLCYLRYQSSMTYIVVKEYYITHTREFCRYIRQNSFRITIYIHAQYFSEIKHTLALHWKRKYARWRENCYSYENTDEGRLDTPKCAPPSVGHLLIF